jgi:hypothetical protein
MKMRVQLILDNGTIIEGEDFHCEYKIHDAYMFYGDQTYEKQRLVERSMGREAPLVSITATIVMKDKKRIDAVMADASKVQL